MLDTVDGVPTAAGFVEQPETPVPGVNPSQSLARPFLFANDLVQWCARHLVLSGQ